MIFLPVCLHWDIIAIQHYIKMYNIIIQHLYVLQNDHHISLGNIIIIHSYNFFLVMETFKINSLGNCQLYSAVSWTIYIPMNYLFYKWKFVSLTLFTHFTLPFCPASGNCQSVVCIYELFFVVIGGGGGGVAFEDSMYKWEIIQYLSFSDLG